MLEFAEARCLTIVNTCFQKEDAKKVTYESGGARTVVDYMLVRKRDRANVLDVKVIPNEECITQHKLMVCQMKISDAVRKVKTKHVS